MDTKIELTEEKVTAAIEAAVARKGEDYVYRSPDGLVSGCLYLYLEDDGTPVRCLIGEVLHELLPEELWRCVVRDYNSEGIVGGNLEDFFRDQGVSLSLDVCQALASAQEDQDTGATWGRALARYHDALAGEDEGVS